MRSRCAGCKRVPFGSRSELELRDEELVATGCCALKIQALPWLSAAKNPPTIGKPPCGDDSVSPRRKEDAFLRFDVPDAGASDLLLPCSALFSIARFAAQLRELNQDEPTVRSHGDLRRIERSIPFLNRFRSGGLVRSRGLFGGGRLPGHAVCSIVILADDAEEKNPRRRAFRMIEVQNIGDEGRLRVSASGPVRLRLVLGGGPSLGGRAPLWYRFTPGGPRAAARFHYRYAREGLGFLTDDCHQRLAVASEVDANNALAQRKPLGLLEIAGEVPAQHVPLHGGAEPPLVRAEDEDRLILCAGFGRTGSLRLGCRSRGRIRCIVVDVFVRHASAAEVFFVSRDELVELSERRLLAGGQIAQADFAVDAGQEAPRAIGAGREELDVRILKAGNDLSLGDIGNLHPVFRGDTDDLSRIGLDGRRDVGRIEMPELHEMGRVLEDGRQPDAQQVVSDRRVLVIEGVGGPTGGSVQVAGVEQGRRFFPDSSRQESPVIGGGRHLEFCPIPFGLLAR